MVEKSKACQEYEELEKHASDILDIIKAERKKKDKSRFQEASKEYGEVMEKVLEAWLLVVDELAIQSKSSATENAFYAGYANGKKLGLSEELCIKRGDHVASKTLYKASKMFPWK